MEISQLKSHLALSFVPGLGCATHVELARKCVDLSNIFEMDSQQLRALGLKPSIIKKIQEPDWSNVDAALEWLESCDEHHIITCSDPRYPYLLRDTEGAAVVLYARGNCQLLNKPQIAMVGSRNPSHTGLEIAQSFATALADVGLVVTSGLALGVDGSAHRGALNAQGGTIAVLGTGVDRIYPSRHRKLAGDILDSGLIISEFPLGTNALAKNFPMRNRIISGMSVGVVVVEAAVRSGSLITARFAIEQGREVFAIPGSIHSPLSKGCHALIQQGAKLVETVSDIIEELQSMLGYVLSRSEGETSSLENMPIQPELLTYIGFEPTSVDLIARRSGITVEKVSARLIELQLQGHILSVAGGYLRN